MMYHRCRITNKDRDNLAIIAEAARRQIAIMDEQEHAKQERDRWIKLENDERFRLYVNEWVEAVKKASQQPPVDPNQ